ncbi:hypothetical protein GCM10011352_38870 [Marinobacterium zhoushanense]|uniref:DUF3775 domain-containing protein n=1 Tax=Marinobacterium zhoushanense TaxID=1679163 RepID=A0ABQ1KVK7_9GAMM|nr:DUF3775 domain-containing protein [Marinobacterium zhoushanense]GGC08742.1 hypothetical protein GCM10011352_38870 [Marinobacterium zhoushanense]
MLNVNSETLCRLIQLAREFHAKEAVTIPEKPISPADDWARQVLADHAGDLTFQEFLSIINDLEPDQQQEVVALLWLGRGDFDQSEWRDALIEAADGWNDHTAHYLIAHPLLADYLADALDQFGFRCDEA